MSDNHRKTVDMPERDPDAMLIILTTQLAEAALAQGYRKVEAEDVAEEALLETWDEGLTPRRWLAAAGPVSAQPWRTTRRAARVLAGGGARWAARDHAARGAMGTGQRSR